MQVIAELLGYRDPANFARAFRGWTGKTPTEYRLLKIDTEAARWRKILITTSNNAMVTQQTYPGQTPFQGVRQRQPSPAKALQCEITQQQAINYDKKAEHLSRLSSATGRRCSTKNTAQQQSQQKMPAQTVSTRRNL